MSKPYPTVKEIIEILSEQPSDAVFVFANYSGEAAINIFPPGPKEERRWDKPLLTLGEWDYH